MHLQHVDQRGGRGDAEFDVEADSDEHGGADLLGRDCLQARLMPRQRHPIDRAAPRRGPRAKRRRRAKPSARSYRGLLAAPTVAERAATTGPARMVLSLHACARARAPAFLRLQGTPMTRHRTTRRPPAVARSRAMAAMPSRNSSPASPPKAPRSSPPTRACRFPTTTTRSRPACAGRALLEDFILREKITHFDHERIPERVVHARGAAAHGYFRGLQVDVAVHLRRLPAGPGASRRPSSCASRPWPARAARPTRCATCAASRSSSTRAKATTTWWATTSRCSSSRTRSSSRT